MDRSEALKVLYDLAEGVLDRGPDLEEWPEAYMAVLFFRDEVYPEFADEEDRRLVCWDAEEIKEAYREWKRKENR